MNLNDGTVRLRRPSDHRTSATFQMDAPDEGRPPSSHEEATRARDSTPDSRFTIVEDLLTSEVVYYDRLKTVFHTYANPLSKWGLTGTDHDMLFGGVDELLRLVESFIRQLDESVQNWDASMVSVGGILNGLGSFWHAYELYCGSQRQLLRRLKDREKNTAFKAFLDVRRESSPNRLSLEALLTLPVQRVSEYHHLLGQLFDTMEHDHPDFDHLSDAVAKANQLVQRRQEEAIFLENQIKLAQVQERFSQNLYLNLPLDCVDSDGRKKKSSLPGHRYGSHGSGGNRIRNGGVRGVSHNTSPGLALRAWKGGPIRTTIRSYVKEGVVQFRTGYSHQDRYLVLFTDLLLVAKAKSQSTFRLKQRLRVSEMWLADCIEEVFETSQKEELSFVLGWPTTNTVATFGSKEDRDAWYVQLSRYINKQRDMVEPRSVSLKVYNRAGDTVNNPQFQIVNVDRNDTAQEVVSLALETVGLKDDPKGYQLWVISGKEESAYPLIGHEYPYAIKLHHVRHTLDSVENDQLRHVSKRGQCQFILKKRKKAQTSTTQQSLTPRRFLYKSIRKAPFVQWATKRRTGTPHGSQERLDCLQLFGVSLSKVTKDGVLPKSILDILVRLYKEGPSVPGVFRRSCNARLARKLKESLNNGEDVSIGDADILVLATVMKEFLRSLPDCIFCCENFADLVATNQNTEDLNRVDGILRVMDRLPLCNYIVLRHFMWVLYRVAENSEHNSMDAHNIALCVSPSLLWGVESVNAVHHEVPPLIEFMVTNCVQIFGNEVPFAFTAGKRLVRVRSDSDGTKYRIHSKQDNMLPRDSVSSTEMEYGESGDEAASPQSTISKDSALTASDSNLYTEQEQSSSNRRESTGSRGNNTAGNRRHGSSYSWKSSSGCGGSVSERDAVEKRGAFCRSKSDDVRVSSESLNGNGGSLPSSLQEDTPFLSGEITASGSMPSLCGEDDMLDTKMMAPAGLPRTYSDIPTSPTKLKSHPMLQRRQTPPKAPPATRRLPGQPPTAPNLVERRERPGAAGQGYVDVSGGWSRPLRQSRVSPRRKHGMGSKSAPSSPETDRALETGQSSRNISLPSYDWAVEQNARVSPGSMSHYVQQSWQLESANKPSRIALDRSYSVGVTTSTASELSTSLGSMSYKAAKSHFYVPHTQASVPEYTTVVTAEVLSGGQMKPNMTTVIHPIIHGKDSPSQSTKKKTMFYHRVSTSGAATPPTRTDLPNFKSKSRSLDTWQKKQGYFYQPESNRDLEVPFHRSSTYSSVRNKSRKDEAFSSFVKDTDMSDFQVNRPRSRHRGLSQKFSFSERSVTEPNIPLTSYQHEVRTSSSMDSCENEMRKFDCDFGLSGSFPEVRRIKSVDQLRQRLESSGVDSSPLPDRRAVVSAFESRSAENFKKPYSSRPFQLKTDISGRYVGLTQPSSHIGAFRRYSPSGHNSPGLLSASSKHHGPPRLRRLPLQRSFDSAMDDISAEEDSTPDEENSELFSGLEESFV